jgi:glycosyltransferase involved in cell wall biosynthesis
MSTVDRLLIVSHVPHYRWDDQLWAFGPFAREIDIWADLFPEVIMAAPLRLERPPQLAVAYSRPNITIRPQRDTGRVPWQLKPLLLPLIIKEMVSAMRLADAIHVRCPGGLGLVGAVLAPLLSSRLVAKYAGQWDSHPDQRLIMRLQRYLLASRWWRGPVTVYGSWPDQPSHIVPFFTSMMSSEMVKRAVEVAERREPSMPLRVLASGRLAVQKRFDALLDAVRIVLDRGESLAVTVVGEGEELTNLQHRCQQLQLQEVVSFAGAFPYEEGLSWYEWADCLVLPSVYGEGWPKVIAEGMCYGLVCVAVAHGQVPEMLEGRGVLLANGAPQEIADALCRLARQPESFTEMRRRASQWARQRSLKDLREALRELLEERWGVKLMPGRTEL